MTRLNWAAIEWSKKQQLEPISSKEEALIKIRDEILNSTPEDLLNKIKEASERNNTVQEFFKEFS